MNSLPSLLNSRPNCEATRAATIDHLKKRGRLENWLGLLGVKSLRRAEIEAVKNREAESAHVRRTAWGATDGASASEAEEDVGDTTLGDKRVTTHHTHNYPPPSGGNLVKGLLGAGLLASGIGAPIGAMFIADALRKPAAVPEPPTVPVIGPDSDTLYQLRLGKPEGDGEP